MTDQDITDPAHRLDNISKGHSFAAYAILRFAVNNPKWADSPVSDLRVLTTLLDADLAQRWGMSPSSVIGRLVDVALAAENDKSAKDEGGSATG